MLKTWLILTLALLATTAAHAKNYQVGKCLQGLSNFTTIQTAVNAVPPGSTIFVCPGTYPEQVTIGQPLTLKGIAFSNQDRPTIVVPGGDPVVGGGLQINVTSGITGIPIAAQVLVNPGIVAGTVNIFDVTVDGSGAICNGFEVAGIFYSSGTTGAVRDSAIRNQNGNQSFCGNGIWIENDSSLIETIGVTGNSVHGFSGRGIAAFSNQNPSTLTVNIQKNALHSDIKFTTGIEAQTVAGTIASNVVIGGNIGIADETVFAPVSTLTIRNNDVANTQVGVQALSGTIAKSNNIANTTYAFLLSGGPATNPGPFLFANTIKNAYTAVEYNCTANVSLKSNTINDAQIAYDSAPPNFTISNGVNPLYNVDTIEAGSCQ